MTGSNNATPARKRSAIDRFLDVVERVGNALPDPTTLFALLALAVVVMSGIAARFDLSVAHPTTGEMIHPVSLLSIEGLHRILKEAGFEWRDYEIIFWAAPLPDVKDWQAAFAWPTEGENYLNWISITATNTGRETTAAQAVVRPRLESRAKAPSEEQVEQKPGLRHTREFAWSWTLAPGQSATGIARYPFYPVDDSERYDAADAALWLRRTEEYWRETIGRAARIEVPCRKATEALKAAHVCQLIANDRGEVRGGEGFYDEFYIRERRLPGHGTGRSRRLGCGP